MRFVLLGSSPIALPLLEAIASAPEHDLTHAAGDPAPTYLQQLFGRVQLVPHAGALPPVSDFDAFIVADETHDVLEEAKQLARTGVPLVIFPTSGQHATFAYELELIAADSQAPLIPLFPQLAEPQVLELAEQIRRGTWGRLSYVELERQRPLEPPAKRLAPADIDAALFADVVLLEHLLGEFDRVTALHSGKSADDISLATVTLAAEAKGSRPDVRWEFRNSISSQAWTLTIAGDTGRTVIPDAESVPSPDQAAHRQAVGRQLLQQVEQRLNGQEIRSNWNDVLRAFDLLEASRESLRRRRTIDLHFETTSERSIFKSQMTAVGCGLLMLTLAAVVLLLIVAAAVDIPAGVMRVARIAVFLPLFAFLAFQVLLLLARPPSRRP